MAQKREKDETLELKVPSETPPLSVSCPEKNCKKIAATTTQTCTGSTGSDPARSRSEARSERGDQAAAEEEPRRLPPPSRGGDAVVARKGAVNRCSSCGKRVGLTGFRCRCGDMFCSEHRYSDRHDCSYDYKGVGREAIARENPVVRAVKILKV